LLIKTKNPFKKRILAKPNLMRDTGLSPTGRVIESIGYVKFVFSETVEVGGFAPPSFWVINQCPHFATPTVSSTYHIEDKKVIKSR